MKMTRQHLFDAACHGFKNWWTFLCYNIESYRAASGGKADKQFHKAFKTVIRPYWRQYGVRARKYWFKEIYLRTGSTDPRYVPESLFARCVVPHFDEQLYIRQLEDKNLHCLIFPGMKRPETVFKHIGSGYTNDDFTPISRQEALARLQTEGDFVVKPTRDTGQGANVRFFHTMSPEETEKLLALYEEEPDYIVQRALRQHPALAHFNPSSLNTIRVVTLVFHDRPHILSAILRIGADGSKVDNISKGGYQAIIRPDGTLEKLAYTHKDGKDRNVAETDRGVPFEGAAVPSWDRIRDTAIELAVRLPHLKLIGWDFAVDEQGDVVLIEFNSELGQNQENCGPTFGDMTDQVLSEVFKRKA